MAARHGEYARPSESISLAAFPQYRPDLADADAERDVEDLQFIITSVRDHRANFQISPRVPVLGTFYGSAAALAVLQSQSHTIAKLANGTLQGVEDATRRVQFSSSGEAEIPEALRLRKKKELDQLEKNIASLERQFADTQSLTRKPQHIVEGMRQKLEEYKGQRDKLL